MRKRVILIGVIILVLICIIIFLIKTEWLKINVNSSEENYPKQNLEKEINYEEGDLNKSNNSENLEKVLKISGGEGGDSSDSMGDSSEIKESCELVQISYSLKNFESKEECLQEEVEECISKQINCTIEIHNLDEQIGSFELGLVLFKEENSESIDYLTLLKDVEGKKFEKVSWSFNVEGNNANEDLSCAFKTTLVPKKEICI